jgi:site-specific recombinase XerD
MMNQRSMPVVTGPLAPFGDGFEAVLVSQGYRPSSVMRRLRTVALLSGWLAGQGLGPADLTEFRLEAFAGQVTGTSRYRRRTCARAVRDLVAYLSTLGVIVPPGVPAASGPYQPLLEDFGRYLVQERGVASHTATVRDYQRIAALFLSGAAGQAAVQDLTTSDVTGFVLARCRGRSPRSARLLATALRSLLRFLFVEGLTPADLSGAVPNVASWRGASLPKAIGQDQVRRLLGSCDRRTAAGRRDYAVLVLLARLGLRAGEVAALQLEDVNWRAGEVLIRGKADRHERLPLPADVGEALAGYLRQGRPRRPDRDLFLQARAPYAPLTSHAVRAIVARAAGRAGLPPLAAHRLRHTAATQMLAAGAPLPEIAGVLRHRNLTSTSGYAKVDYASLGEVAQRWPAGAR